MKVGKNQLSFHLIDEKFASENSNLDTIKSSWEVIYLLL